MIGLASSVLFDKAKPLNPVNRRISIIVLNKATEAAIGFEEGKVSVKPQDVPKELKQPKTAS